MSDDVTNAGAARADLYRFLAACYYEPSPMFAEEKLFDSLLMTARAVHPDLGEPARRLGEAFAAQDLQTLLVDYSRLFLGPLPALAQPYGACWLVTPADPAQNLAPAVLDWYIAGGFDIDETFLERLDHVAVELEFLYLLTYRCHEALAAGDASAVLETELLQHRFLSQHLGAWIAPFTAAVTAQAQTTFYRELAGLTAQFVQMEMAALTNRCGAGDTPSFET